MYIIIIYDIILSTYKLTKGVKMFSNGKLKELRIQKGYSQTAIAEQLEVSRAAYSNWENGKRKPNQIHLRELAKFFHIEVTDFFDLHPFMNKYHRLLPMNQKKIEDYADELLLEQNDRATPLYSVRVLENIILSAGLGETIYDEHEAVEVFTDRAYSYDVATWIKGDSMEPVYHNGEVALIQLDGFDYNGTVYAISWNDKLYIKKVYLEKDGYRLVSLNKKYEDMFAPANEYPRIVGKVKDHFYPYS